MWRHSKAYFAAVVTIYLVGSVAITQMNLQSLIGLGAQIPVSVRWHATWTDLQGLLVPYLILIAIGVLIAVVVTGQISRFFPRYRMWLYPIACAVALLAIHLLLKGIFGLWGVAGARPLLGCYSRVWRVAWAVGCTPIGVAARAHCLSNSGFAVLLLGLVSLGQQQ